MTKAADATSIAAFLSAKDRKLAKVIRQVGPITLPPPRGDLFQTLLRSIVYQQLSGKAAGTIHGRVVALLPRKAAEQPPAVLQLTDDALRGAGLSRGKLLAIRDLATRAGSGLVPNRKQLTRLDDEAIIERLSAIRGVGRWTAEMILIFWLKRPDVLPLDDLGVRRGFSIVQGQTELPTAAALQAYGERWRPFRSAASWYLWRAVDLHRAKATG